MVNKGDVFLAVSNVLDVPNQKVIFRHMQLGFAEFPDMAMYDLTDDIKGHPKASTISRNTLLKCGFVLPQEAP